MADSAIVEILKYIILAGIQGITEIFPVSSSGHLVIYGHVLGKEISFEYVLFLHLGTLLAIFLFYSRDLYRILSGNLGWKLPILMTISFVTTSLVGLIFESQLANSLVARPREIAILWIVNGFLVGLAGKFSPQGLRKIIDLSLWDFLAIGFIQGISPLPGISRLGLTLGTGLILSMSWFEALKLSFLLSIPVIFFGNLLKFIQYLGLLDLPLPPISLMASLLQHVVSTVTPIQWVLYGITLLISFGTGLWAIHILSRFLSRRLLTYFGIYSAFAGIFFIFFIPLM